MSPEQLQVITSLRNYCNDTLEGKTDDCDNPGVLSALVNTVDTAMENPDHPMRQGLQVQREIAVVDFILCHINHKQR